MRANRRYYKKALADVVIWVLLLGSVIFLAVCPPVAVVLMALILRA